MLITAIDEKVQELAEEKEQISFREDTEKESIHAKLEAGKEKAAAQPRKEVKAKNNGQEI